MVSVSFCGAFGMTLVITVVQLHRLTEVQDGQQGENEGLDQADEQVEELPERLERGPAVRGQGAHLGGEGGQEEICQAVPVRGGQVGHRVRVTREAGEVVPRELVGPEGGFSKEEERLMDSRGVQRARLSTGVLRSELAGFAALLLISEMQEGS